MQPLDLGGDGDCQFRALAYHLGGGEDDNTSDEVDHRLVRSEVVQFMRDSKEFRKEFAAFSTTRNHKAFDTWLDEMGQEGTPG